MALGTALVLTQARMVLRGQPLVIRIIRIGMGVQSDCEIVITGFSLLANDVITWRPGCNDYHLIPRDIHQSERTIFGREGAVRASLDSYDSTRDRSLLVQDGPRNLADPVCPAGGNRYEYSQEE
jgi:hypothetical protein